MISYSRIENILGFPQLILEYKQTLTIKIIIVVLH